MMKVAIIDDEVAAREILRKICGQLPKTIQVCGEADHIEAGIELIRSQQPDLVLLDIEFPEGTGFEILEALKDTKLEVIFITAHDDYALKAIKYHALDYILKPIDTEEVLTALDAAVKRIKGGSGSRWSYLLEYLSGSNHDKFPLPIKDGYRYVRLNELVHLKADGSYTDLFLSTKERITISKKLAWFEQRLCELGFLRVHRSYMVNEYHISELHRDDGGYLITSLGTRVEVSRSFFS